MSNSEARDKGNLSQSSEMAGKNKRRQSMTFFERFLGTQPLEPHPPFTGLALLSDLPSQCSFPQLSIGQSRQGHETSSQ